jgi:hypothetical protein
MYYVHYTGEASLNPFPNPEIAVLLAKLLGRLDVWTGQLS